MALGPENFNATIQLNSLFCFQGDDIHDLFGSDSEPYLWTIMVKIDGEGLHQQDNFLAGEAKFFFSPGSHGNLGGSMGTGQTRRIPAEVGSWTTSLRPIPISVVGQTLTEIPGVILCCAVLMEENLTPGDAMEAGHQSLNTLVRNTVADAIASIGLAGFAADVAAVIAFAASHGTIVSVADATQTVLDRRLAPIKNLFTVAAPANLVTTIIGNLGLGGFIGTALDADKPMGVFFQAFTQSQLAASFAESFGLPSDYGRITINDHMWNMPAWAYTLHGSAWAHHKFVRRAPPASTRLQISCTSKRRLPDGPHISGIGGIDGDVMWALGRDEAADLVRNGEKSFFVTDAAGHTVDVHAVQGGFRAGSPWFYLQTQPDASKANNLVSLPDCLPGAIQMEIWY